MEKIEKEHAGYIELKFGPRWKYIAVVRAFIQNFLAISFTDPSLADKLAMAISELLENAVKYASGNDDETSVNVALNPENDGFSVSVTNSSTPESIASLKANWANAMEGEPLAAYIKKMQEAAVRTDSKSQLGIVRIRYETGADMALSVDGNKVTITLSHNKDK
jgi:hypothetical protein